MYRVTQAKIRAMEGLPAAAAELAAEEVEDLEQAEPLLDGFTLDDPPASTPTGQKGGNETPEILI